MKRFFTLLATLLLLSVAAFASAGGKVLGIVMPNGGPIRKTRNNNAKDFPDH